MIKTIIKKNFILWKRNFLGALLEVLVPIVLILGFFYLMRINPIEIHPETFYSPVSQPNQSNLALFSNGQDDVLRYKNCLFGLSGGRIGLMSKNPITEKIRIKFQSFFQDVVYFENEQQITDYIKSDDYNSFFPNNTRKQLCFVVAFNHYDPENHQYEYQLKFNISNPFNADHWDTRWQTKVGWRVDNVGYTSSIYNNGVLSTQILIDNFILQEATNNSSIFSLTKMPTPEFVVEPREYLQMMCTFLFIFFSSFNFLKTISSIVSDRETKNLENMETMGLSRKHYFKGFILFSLIKQTILSVIISVFMNFFIIPYISYLFVFSIYFIFSTNMMLIAIIVSCFFKHTKKALVYGIIVFFALCIPYIISQKFQDSEMFMNFLALSPCASMGFTFTGIQNIQNYHQEYKFEYLFMKMDHFRGILFFVFNLVQMILFYFLSYYLFMVISHDGVSNVDFLFFIRKKEQRKSKVHHQSNKENDLQEHFLDQSNYESVETTLTKQKELKKVIQISNLSKQYSNGKKALKNLTIDLYQNQILSLLGHNGAGKTTFIKILSGFHDKTDGNIDIFGLDFYKDREEIQKIMGICHQHNTIFDQMTVEEHLQLYGAIKKVPEKELNLKIDEVLKVLDLNHKRNFQAQNLSGGQKRKLCVAIAFIGGSKVIILDEPTSGMDAHARRFLWDAIKVLKKDRIVLLTTHDMNEADYLGDRIAIMHDGSLVTLGTSVFLKQKYGSGYHLTFIKKKAFEERHQEMILKLISNFCESFTIENSLENELKLNLPYQNMVHFQQLFTELEENIDQYEIRDFGLSLNSLQDVFINVTLKNENETDKLLLEQIEGPFDMKIDPLHEIRYDERIQLYFHQCRGFLSKRIIYLKRDRSILICEFLIPLLMVCLGVFFTNLNFFKTAPPLELSADIYPKHFNINQSPFSEDFIKNLDTGFQIKKLETADFNQFNNAIFQNRAQEQNYSFLVNDFGNKFDVNIFWNSTATFAPFAAINMFSNSVLREKSSKSAPYIKSTLNPFIQTSKIISYEKAAGGLLLAMFISLGYLFITANWIVTYVKERHNNSKHQQIVSGGNIFVYWFSNFFIDFAKYLIIMALTLLIVKVSDIRLFLDDDHFQMFACLILFNGITMLWTSYLFSIFFKTPFKAQIFFFTLNLLFSIVFMILSLGFKLMDKTKDIWDQIEIFLLLFPSYSFSMGILQFSMISVLSYKNKWVNARAFDWQVSGKYLCFLAVTGIFYFLFLFIFELKEYTNFKYKKQRKQSYSIVDDRPENSLNSANDLGKEEDEDIREEIEMIKENKNLSVKVQNLSKTYGQKQGAFKMLNKEYKQALKGISFGLTPGSVFGLLGTNGAGKSTTFKIMTGEVGQTKGTVNYFEYKMPMDFLKLRKFLGYCPQTDPIFSKMTVIEHLQIYAKIKGIRTQYHKRLINILLQDLGLEIYKNYEAGNLSGGNKRKLCVAMALLGNPQIILMDEPSSGMDPGARINMWKIMNKMISQNKDSTFIITTHSLEEAETLCSKLAILVEGNIKSIGSLQHLKNKYNKGFEIDFKLLKIEKEEFQELKTKIKRCLEVKKSEALKQIVIKKHMARLHSQNIFRKIELKDILQQEDEEITLNEFVERLDARNKIFLLDTFMIQTFDAQVCEKFWSYARYKVSQEFKLSQIFGEIEKRKQELSLMNYQVRESSLEQIFIDLSKSTVHDEEIVAQLLQNKLLRFKF